jgi:hypothetical protein
MSEERGKEQDIRSLEQRMSDALDEHADRLVDSLRRHSEDTLRQTRPRILSHGDDPFYREMAEQLEDDLGQLLTGAESILRREQEQLRRQLGLPDPTRRRLPPDTAGPGRQPPEPPSQGK